jgi:hypothetical protein
MLSKFSKVSFLVALLALVLAGPSTAEIRDKRILDLSADDKARNDRQRRIVDKLVKENFGYVKLEGSKSDLYYLQRIVDKKLVGRHDGYDLQALGVILGDIMDRNLPVRWVVVEDKYGRSRALQFEETKSLYYPVTMISRRLQNNMEVNVRQLYKDTELSVKALQYRKSKYQQVPGENGDAVSKL